MNREEKWREQRIEKIRRITQVYSNDSEHYSQWDEIVNRRFTTPTVIIAGLRNHPALAIQGAAVTQAMLNKLAALFPDLLYLYGSRALFCNKYTNRRLIQYSYVIGTWGGCKLSSLQDCGIAGISAFSYSNAMKYITPIDTAYLYSYRPIIYNAV